MAEISLDVVRREERGKGAAGRLRKQGQVPAVVYGGGKDPVSITVNQKTVSELISKSEHGLRSIFLLALQGSDQKRHAMIKEIKVDPISGRFEHIDFVRVAMDHMVRVTIPVHLSGLASGVKNSGGILEFQVRELHVECLPGAIPDSFDVDVTAMEIHDVIRIADLKIPEGVKLFDDEDRVVVSIGVPRAEEVIEAVAGEAEAAEPELIKRGKVEEEEADDKKKADEKKK